MARTASTVDIAPAGTLNQDVPVGGAEFLTVIAVVGTVANAAGAAGDVSVAVIPYLDDGTSGTPNGTLAPATFALPVMDTVAAALSGSRAYILVRVRVSGLGRVQIQAKNNNVAAKPVEVNFGIVG